MLRPERVPGRSFRDFKRHDLDSADTLLEWIAWEANWFYEDLSPKQRYRICREIAEMFRAIRARANRRPPDAAA